VSDDFVSRTDPDATHTGRARSTSRLGYNAHYVVDGGKARIILSNVKSVLNGHRSRYSDPHEPSITERPGEP
jgi:hypothetical protein